jgi:hypothetical protein
MTKYKLNHTEEAVIALRAIASTIIIPETNFLDHTTSIISIATETINQIEQKEAVAEHEQKMNVEHKPDSKEVVDFKETVRERFNYYRSNPSLRPSSLIGKLDAINSDLASHTEKISSYHIEPNNETAKIIMNDLLTCKAYAEEALEALATREELEETPTPQKSFAVNSYYGHTYFYKNHILVACSTNQDGTCDYQDPIEVSEFNKPLTEEQIQEIKNKLF